MRNQIERAQPKPLLSEHLYAGGVPVPANWSALPWQLAELDLEAVDRRAITDDGLAFRILFVASLVEAGSDLYAANLVTHFAGDAQLTRWLRSSWRPEEMQH